MKNQVNIVVDRLYLQSVYNAIVKSYRERESEFMLGRAFDLADLLVITDSQLDQDLYCNADFNLLRRIMKCR